MDPKNLACSNLQEENQEEGEKASMDFRLFLQKELLARCKKNPHYSLRSMAKSLNIDHSTLGQILRGKRALTSKAILKLGKALKLNEEDLKKYAANTSLKQEPLHTDSYQNYYKQLALDTFHYISDWYHLAILELLKIDSFLPETSWVAEKLALEKEEVELALERLVRLGLLKIHENGTWEDLSEGFTTTVVEEEITNNALKNLQKSYLKMACGALDEVDIAQRDQTAMTMAINPKNLKKAKEMIKIFRRNLCALLEDGPQKEVYQLTISLFPLTQLKESRYKHEKKK